MHRFRFAAIFLMTAHIALAQTARITGVVRDSGGLPLAGASVFLKNNKLGTHTDSTGRYELTVNPGEQTIVASFVGYAEQEKNISLQRGTVTGQDFIVAEVYIECPEVIVICSPNESRVMPGKLFFLSEAKAVSGKKTSELIIRPLRKSIIIH